MTRLCRRWYALVAYRTPLLLVVGTIVIAPWIGMQDGVRPLDVLTRSPMEVHAQSHAASKAFGQEGGGHGPSSSNSHAPDEVHAPGTCSCCPIDQPRLVVAVPSNDRPCQSPPDTVPHLTDRYVSPESPPPQI